MQPSPTLHRISREGLSSLLLSPTSSPHIAVIDVRDSDHVGGHIRGSAHVPTPTLDYRLPELVRTLRHKETVVFHCALSQQRGPGAALRYMRERDKRVENAKIGGEEEEEGGEREVGGKSEAKEQSVYVLEGGFVKWQEKYGKDERLTEAYQPDIWVDY